MANNKNNNSTISLRSVLEKDKLTRTNFLDWFRNLRIVLKQERKLYVLDEPLPEEPADNAPRAEKNAYEKHHNNSIDVACLMLVRAPPPGPLRRGVVPLTGCPPSSQGFLSPPWARTCDHELRYPFEVVPTTN